MFESFLLVFQEKSTSRDTVNLLSHLNLVFFWLALRTLAFWVSVRTIITGLKV